MRRLSDHWVSTAFEKAQDLIQYIPWLEALVCKPVTEGS